MLRQFCTRPNVIRRKCTRRNVTEPWKAHKSFTFIYTHYILNFKDDFFSPFSTVKFSEHPIDRVTTKNETSRDKVTYNTYFTFLL